MSKEMERLAEALRETAKINKAWGLSVSLEIEAVKHVFAKCEESQDELLRFLEALDQGAA